jgi:hypothetical protein
VSSTPPNSSMSQEPLCCAALFSNKSLLLTLDIEGITAPQLALIDSGSSANFIDAQFALQHSLALIELDTPCQVIRIRHVVQDSCCAGSTENLT